MINNKSKFQSPQSLVLRFMREKRQMTLLSAGKAIGLKPKIIDHIENGRKTISEEDLLLFLDCYNFSFEVYSEMLELKPLNKQTANYYFLSRKFY